VSEPVELNSADFWPEGAGDDDEAYLANWFVRPGSPVRKGTALCEIQVLKATLDVESPVGGHLEEVLVEEGGTFRKGTILARLRPEG